MLEVDVLYRERHSNSCIKNNAYDKLCLDNITHNSKVKAVRNRSTLGKGPDETNDNDKDKA
jgi:hypothetical protein